MALFCPVHHLKLNFLGIVTKINENRDNNNNVYYYNCIPLTANYNVRTNDHE